MVVVTVGGGQDGYALIQRYLEGLVAVGPSCPWRSLIVTGPFMRTEQQAAVRKAAYRLPEVSVVTFTPRLHDVLAAADLVVTMGGYNSLVELVAQRKRAVVVPRVYPRTEQLLRAKRFDARGLLQLVDPRTSGVADLTNAVRRVLTMPPPRTTLDLRGIDRTVEAVSDLMGLPAEGAGH